MTNPFEEARKGAKTVKQVRHQMMVGFLEHRYTQEDIKNLYSEHEERNFWEEFRIHYQNADNNKTLFLERLDASVSGGDGGLSLNRGRANSEFNPKEATTIEPLPEPSIPRRGRRGSDTPRQPGPVVRAIRRIGRLFGKRDT